MEHRRCPDHEWGDRPSLLSRPDLKWQPARDHDFRADPRRQGDVLRRNAEPGGENGAATEETPIERARVTNRNNACLTKKRNRAAGRAQMTRRLSRKSRDL